MNNLYNHTVFLLYLGGVFSLLLTVSIVYVKQIQKRNIERKRLEQVKQFKPEEIGDIEAKLNDSFDFRFPIFLHEITIWGIQPLFIIAFVNLFTGTGEGEIIIAFLLVILTLFHEFHFADKFSNNRWYQSFVIFIWVVTFVIISFRTNKIEEKIKDDKQKLEQLHTTLYLQNQRWTMKHQSCLLLRTGSGSMNNGHL